MTKTNFAQTLFHLASNARRVGRSSKPEAETRRWAKRRFGWSRRYVSLSSVFSCVRCSICRDSPTHCLFCNTIYRAAQSRASLVRATWPRIARTLSPVSPQVPQKAVDANSVIKISFAALLSRNTTRKRFGKRNVVHPSCVRFRARSCRIGRN